jgi:hypothetical protein
MAWKAERPEVYDITGPLSRLERMASKRVVFGAVCLE